MRILLISAIVLCAPGCMWVETMTKAATDAALDAVSERMKIIPKELVDMGKGLKNEAIEAASEAGAKMAVKQGRRAMMFVVRQADLDPMSFDNDADGVVSDMELNMAVNAAKKSGNLPWYLQVLLGIGSLGGAGGLFSIVKSGRRKLLGIEANGAKKKA